MMKSETLGESISQAEITNISGNRFWILLGGEELFLPFDQFPWFKKAQVGQILNVERPAPDHLYWPELDVDLELESIRHPERFPLVAKV